MAADSSTPRAARSPVERIRGPVLLLSGGDDQLWPSTIYADRIMASLRDDPSPHTHLDFPAAGHLLFDIPYLPASTEASGTYRDIELGGTPSANDADHERAWPGAHEPERRSRR